MARYLLQVWDTERNAVVTSWAPGGPVETELVTHLCERVRVKGVGLGRTEAHVVSDVQHAFEELLHDLKRRV